MITVEDLSIQFGGRVIFENANFSINYGEKVGLVGKNGAGKSTFLKLILGKIESDSGKVEVSDGYTIGHLDQHISFTHKTVLDEVCSILPPEREFEGWKGDKILTGLGFTDEQKNQDPQLFSGGWQVKINLAKILLSEPHMLLLDEPTNYLDIYSVKWLTDFLKKWQGELILITHDKAFMNNVITHTLLIHRCEFKKGKGNPDKLKNQIAVEEEIYEKTRIAEEKKRKETQDWINKFGSKASKASVVQSKVKMLEKVEVKEKLGFENELDFNFSYSPFSSRDYMIEVEDLSFGYQVDKILFQNLWFKVEEGDKICIIGKNGNGKSTLLNVVAQNLNPLQGKVKMHPKVIVNLFSQMNKENLDPNNTICEELQTVDASIPYGTIRKTAAKMLFSSDLANKKISVLSGGEKSRVMLGKILLNPANLLLLDEPTNHFDLESCESLLGAIKSFEGTVMMVTHNEYFLHEVANKLIVFDDGKTFFFDGTYKKFLDEIGWKED